jgi:hypothetical protein
LELQRPAGCSADADSSAARIVIETVFDRNDVTCFKPLLIRQIENGV